MSRTPGAYDLQPRNHRSDIGKHRKLYRGKPVKTKYQIRFEKKRGNKEFIKIYVWEEKPMSYDGYRRWNRNCRVYARKIIYKPLQVHLVHTSEIDTKKKIEDFVVRNYWDGTFLIKGFSNAKNKYHCKQVKLCRIIVRTTDKGNLGKMVNNYRLGRYKWFYNG